MTTNDEERYIKNRKRIVLIGAAAFFILVIISIILAKADSIHNRVFIKGLENCVANLDGSQKDYIYKSIFTRASEHNGLNGKETKWSYDAEVREGSCGNDTNHFEGSDYARSTFIVDIPDLQYSYRVRYNNTSEKIKNASNSSATPEAIAVYCLEKDEMIYPDFGCEKAQTTSKEPDPIMMAVGTLYKDCELTYTSSGTSKSGYALIMDYRPKNEDVYYDGSYVQLRQKCFDDIKQHLKDLKIDINNYFVYEKTYR